MAFSITVGYPGVSVQDTTTPNSFVTPYGCGLIIGTAAKGTQNVPKLVTSVEQFDTDFGTSPSKKYIKSWFENLTNRGVRLYFMKSNADATPATSAEWIASIKAIDIGLNPGGIIVVPEAFETLTDAAERKSIVDELVKICDFNSGSMWLSIADINPTILTVANAVTEITAWQVPKGEVFTYYPHYENTDKVELLPSAGRAAKILSLWSNGEYWRVPAGVNDLIADASKLKVVVKESEYSTLHSANINLLRNFIGYGIAANDSVTLSKSAEYYQINSVVCFRIVAYLLKIGMDSFVHKPIYGNATIVTEAEATVNRIMFSCLQSGYIVRREGRPLTDAYTITTRTENLPEPRNAVLIIDVTCRPAYALQEVIIYLQNDLGFSPFLPAPI